jgi:hypothetical protein
MGIALPKVLSEGITFTGMTQSVDEIPVERLNGFVVTL